MKTYSYTFTCALCAVPALVQPASAEELCKAEATLVELVEVSSAYLATIWELFEEKVTVDDAIVTVTELTKKVEALHAEMQAFSEEDMKDLEMLLQIPEVIQSGEEFEEAAKEVCGLLIEAEYFGSPELKAACEKFEKIAF